MRMTRTARRTKMAIDYERLAKLLDGCSDAVILTHKSPDGDCLGAGLALCRYFRLTGRRANVLNSDGIPERYAFLAEWYADEELKDPVAVISVDVADTSLLGEALEGYSGSIDICIDHHKSNKLFAKQNFVDDKACAASLVLYELFEHMGYECDRIIASCLYTGIATDTGCFKFSNTSPKAHRAAADLIERGIDYAGINRRMFEIKSRGRIFAEQKLIGRMKFYGNDRIALITITNEMIENYGIDRAELDGFASIPLTVEGVEIGITLKQQELEPNVFKASIRTTKADASRIAAKFGGGGHDRAAGCTITADAHEATRLIVAEAEKYL